MELDLERELRRLAMEQANDEVPPEGHWTEWSPVPFGKPPEVKAVEPPEFPEAQRRKRAA
jgi:hypothetical protein